MSIFKRFSDKSDKSSDSKSNDETELFDENASLAEGPTSETSSSEPKATPEVSSANAALSDSDKALISEMKSEPTKLAEVAPKIAETPIPRDESTLSQVSAPLPNKTEAPIEPPQSDPQEKLLRDIRDSLSPNTSDMTRRADLSEMRLDVARITSDIDSGEALYRRAQQRVENLMGYIEKAEVDFSLLDRLEPENRRLKSQNRTLNSEIENQKARIAVLSSHVEDYRQKAQDAVARYDATSAQLAQTSRRFDDAVSDNKRLKDDVGRMSLELERAKTDKDVETRENRSLKSKITQLSSELADLNAEKLNLAKNTESLKIDYEDQRTAKESLGAEVTDLRNALSDAQTQNNQFKSELVRVHEEIKSFKTQYEYNILTRDERIIALERKITDLTDKLRMKEQIVESAARDVSALRKERSAQDMERERLEKTLRQQSENLATAHEELVRSKHGMKELDQRYKDVATALEVAQQRRRVDITSEYPDIQPAMDIDINDYDMSRTQSPSVDSPIDEDSVFKRGIRPMKESG